MSASSITAVAERSEKPPVGKALATLACAALVVAVLALVVGGFDVVNSAPSLNAPANTLAVASGSARKDGDRLIVDRLGDKERLVVVLPNARLRASDFRAIEIEIRGVPAPDNLAFIWRTQHSGGRTFLRGADALTDTAAIASVRADPNWSGEILGVGFVVNGPTPGPVVIESLRVATDSALQDARETLRDWFAFRGWNGNSINITLLRSDMNAMSLTLFVTLAVALALIAWWAMRRGTRGQLVAGALAIVACAWLIQDARWLANLARQVADTRETFARKSAHDQRLAMPDGPLFAFLEQVKQSIGPSSGRVFFGSDDAYIRSRAGYHLLPRNALSIVYHPRLHGPEFVRPGDFLCVYGRSGVKFDAAAGMLSWDGNPPLRAERTLDAPPGALYRILP